MSGVDKQVPDSEVGRKAACGGVQRGKGVQPEWKARRGPEGAPARARDSTRWRKRGIKTDSEREGSERKRDPRLYTSGVVTDPLAVTKKSKQPGYYFKFDDHHQPCPNSTGATFKLYDSLNALSEAVQGSVTLAGLRKNNLLLLWETRDSDPGCLLVTGMMTMTVEQWQMQASETAFESAPTPQTAHSGWIAFAPAFAPQI